jgi:hypothetical protein
LTLFPFSLKIGAGIEHTFTTKRQTCEARDTCAARKCGKNAKGKN